MFVSQQRSNVRRPETRGARDGRLLASSVSVDLRPYPQSGRFTCDRVALSSSLQPTEVEGARDAVRRRAGVIHLQFSFRNTRPWEPLPIKPGANRGRGVGEQRWRPPGGLLTVRYRDLNVQPLLAGRRSSRMSVLSPRDRQQRVESGVERRLLAIYRGG